MITVDVGSLNDLPDAGKPGIRSLVGACCAGRLDEYELWYDDPSCSYGCMLMSCCGWYAICMPSSNLAALFLLPTSANTACLMVNHSKKVMAKHLCQHAIYI